MYYVVFHNQHKLWKIQSAHYRHLHQVSKRLAAQYFLQVVKKIATNQLHVNVLIGLKMMFPTFSVWRLEHEWI